MKQRHIDKTLWVCFAAASAILAWEPLHWLAQSWIQPSYGSEGYVFAAIVVALAAWSLTSGPARGGDPGLIGLLVAAAALRLAGQVLAINLISGLALAVDVYALARLFGLDRRPVALSPMWLAILFLFALPIEAAVQRSLGYPLQRISAEIACGLLQWIVDDVVCTGLRLDVSGQEVLVDLPCSGAAGVLSLLAGFAALNAVYRPRVWVALAWTLVLVTTAILGNGVRITALALGLVWGIDTVAEPLHSLIGAATLALSALPVIALYRPRPATRQRPISIRTPRTLPRALAAITCLGLAIWIVAQPGRPVDVSARSWRRDCPAK